jgi:hypothetical protein
MARIPVGLRQASAMAQMSYTKRLSFIAEGLPIILNSAHGFIQAGKSLPDESREREVLYKFAEEEAAKALILIDVARCPQSLVSSKIGTMTKWFYDHLARLLYANACMWRPTDVLQLQEYTVNDRKTHYLDGDYGEYIFPNFELFMRESALYADVAAEEQGEPFWHDPSRVASGVPSSEPYALRVVEALDAVGILSTGGIQVIAQVWGTHEFVGKKGASDSDALIKETLGLLIARKLPKGSAEQSDVGTIYNGWQFPMYNLNLRPIEVSLEELQEERDTILWNEMS